MILSRYWIPDQCNSSRVWFRSD